MLPSVRAPARGAMRVRGPTRVRSAGSVSSLTPSSSIRVVACPSQVIATTSVRHPSTYMTDDRSPTADAGGPAYGEQAAWSPQAPRLTLGYLLVLWLGTAVAVIVAALILPGVTVGTFGEVVVAAALIAVLNGVLPPIVAALRLPFTLLLGFVLVLIVDALTLLLASHITSKGIHVDSFGWALLAALVLSAAIVVLDAILGANDEQHVFGTRDLADRAASG